MINTDEEIATSATSTTSISTKCDTEILCCICLDNVIKVDNVDNVDNINATICCGNYVHKDCLVVYFLQKFDTCPLCREDMNIRNYFVIRTFISIISKSYFLQTYSNFISLDNLCDIIWNLSDNVFVYYYYRVYIILLTTNTNRIFQNFIVVFFILLFYILLFYFVILFLLSD